MSWFSFILGGLTVTFAYALFTSEGKEETETDLEENESNLVVKGLAGRFVTLSCQTCRKLKRHCEVESNLYQCTKCKRYVDLRRVS